MQPNCSDYKNDNFETECFLYLKAYDNARNEIDTSIKLQYDTVKIGFTALSVISTLLAGFLYYEHPMLTALILLFIGLLTCGFLFMLLTGEIRIMRAGGFCKKLEASFQTHPQIAKVQKKFVCPPILWEEFITRWNKGMFIKQVHYERKTLYAPFRILITVIDLLVLAFIFRMCQQTRLVLNEFIICCIIWIIIVSAQVYLIYFIVIRFEMRLEAFFEQKSEAPDSKLITWNPKSWINFLKLFLILDILFPKGFKTKEENAK